MSEKDIPKEIEPELRHYQLTGYFDGPSNGFSGVAILDTVSGKFVGTMSDGIGPSVFIGNRSGKGLTFIKMYDDPRVNPNPISYQYERYRDNKWEGTYSAGPFIGSSRATDALMLFDANGTSVEDYKKRLEGVSALIAARRQEFSSMQASPDDGYYEPGSPRTYGLLSRPLTEEDISGFFGNFSSDESLQRLSDGRDSDVNAIINMLRRDSLLATFPDMMGVKEFLKDTLPGFRKAALGDEITDESDEKITKLSVKLLANVINSPNAVIEGGQEAAYISLRNREKEASYEYIGEAVMRIFREEFVKDSDPRVSAFFGWVGRHLMKKIDPSTDFSFDRHNQMVEEDRKVMLDLFCEFREAFEKGIEGEFGLDNCYAFFGKLREIAGDFPDMFSSQTPLQLRIYQDLSEISSFVHIQNLLPVPEGFYWETSNKFSDFANNWRKPEEGGWSYKKSYTECYPDIFGDITPDGEVTEEILMQKWFRMLTETVSEAVSSTEKDAREFEVTYFRFIPNRVIAEGYAFAQKHIEDILAKLPEIIRLSDDEIRKKFMQGAPPIFYDKDDSGQNMSEDWRDQAEDHYKWVLGSTIK